MASLKLGFQKRRAWNTYGFGGLAGAGAGSWVGPSSLSSFVADSWSVKVSRERVAYARCRSPARTRKEELRASGTAREQPTLRCDGSNVWRASIGPRAQPLLKQRVRGGINVKNLFWADKSDARA